MGTLYAILGLIVGAVIAIVSSLGSLASSAFGGDGGPGFPGAFFGVLGIVILPILYGCMGFIASLVGAWLYNQLAGAVGGIEIEVEPR
jgi:hypothetical protein